MSAPGVSDWNTLAKEPAPASLRRSRVYRLLAGTV
jgi:hypothetical protein